MKAKFQFKKIINQNQIKIKRMSNRTKKFLNQTILNRLRKLTKKTLSIFKETFPTPTQLNRQKT